METRVIFFGKLQDVAGRRERTIELPDRPINADTLIDLIAADDDALGDALQSKHIRLVADHKVIQRDQKILRPAEIAFLPPVSGG